MSDEVTAQDSSFAATTLPEFSPPGNLQELTKENRGKWSVDFISKWMNDEIAGVGGRKGRTALTQFFNGTVTAFEAGQSGVNIQWTGFPNKIAKQYPSDEARWRAADATRDVQDEYLEWSLIRDNNDNIITICFTCEGPEYWKFLAAVQRDTALEKIYELNKPLLNTVPKKAFFINPWDPEDRWVYNPKNPYNSSTTTGTITHLIQGANTLGAEVDIAAQATVLRKNDKGEPITDSDKLIRCSQYGSPDRNSDPRIGYKINQLALTGASVSIADPVGLYMNKFDTSSFRLDPTGDQSDLQKVPKETFVFQRGDISKQQGLRLRIQVPDGVKGPDGRQLTVSDIYDIKTNTNIQYGAQFADYITMGVKGVAITGGKPAPAEFCYKTPGPKAAQQFNSLADVMPLLQSKIETEASPFSRL